MKLPEEAFAARVEERREVNLSGIAGKHAICMGIRLKNQRFSTFHLGSIASKIAICIGIRLFYERKDAILLKTL